MGLRDMKGLMGDSSDNYPGVTKVGEKTAVKLLQEFGSVEGIYEHVDEMKKSKLKENLINDKELAFLSKKLARINVESPLEITLEDTLRKEQDVEALMAFYKEMNFNSFQSDLLNSGAATVEEAPKAERPNVKRVTEITEELLKDATSVHFETLEANYHVAQVIAVAFGNEKEVFVTDLDTAVASKAFKEWLADASAQKHLFLIKSK